jgi:hypothetical protein
MQEHHQFPSDVLSELRTHPENLCVGYSYYILQYLFSTTKLIYYYYKLAYYFLEIVLIVTLLNMIGPLCLMGYLYVWHALEGTVLWVLIHLLYGLYIWTIGRIHR